MNMRDQTGSGLIEDYDLDIKDAKFFHDMRFKDGEVIILELTGINSETSKEETLWLKGGRFWHAEDDGARAEYTGTAKHPKFNNNTQYGKWINSFVRCDGADEVMAEKNMDATVAESWVGLNLGVHVHMEQYNIEGVQSEGRVYTVTALNGVVFNEAEAEKAEEPEIPKATMVKLTKLAKDSGSFEAFVDRAYDEIGGLTGSSYEDFVTDDSASGFFAVHGG